MAATRRSRTQWWFGPVAESNAQRARPGRVLLPSAVVADVSCDDRAALATAVVDARAAVTQAAVKVTNAPPGWLVA